MAQCELRFDASISRKTTIPVTVTVPDAGIRTLLLSFNNSTFQHPGINPTHQHLCLLQTQQREAGLCVHTELSSFDFTSAVSVKSSMTEEQ